MLETLNRDDFFKCLNEKFEVEFENDNFTEVKLIEVSELKDYPGQISFSLVFLAPVDTPTIPNTFKIRNEKLGEFQIFMTPFFQDEKGVSFESAFSRLID